MRSGWDTGALLSPPSSLFLGAVPSLLPNEVKHRPAFCKGGEPSQGLLPGRGAFALKGESFQSIRTDIVLKREAQSLRGEEVQQSASFARVRP